MNKILKFLLINFFIFVNISFARLPSWVENPDSRCDRDEICAVGYGNSLNIATSNAKTNIQKVFETKIKSSFNSRLSNNNGEINDFTAENLQENTEGILNGVVIKKTHQNDNTFYVLAVLNKKEYAKIVKFDIEKLDARLKILTSDRNFSRKSAKKLYDKRESLNKRYMFLTGREIPEKTNYKDLFKEKDFSSMESFYLDFDNDRIIKNHIIKALADNNIKIVSKKIDNVLRAELSFEKEFLNVKGFEKYRVNFKIDLIKNGSIVNSINTDFSETGVNLMQIKSKSIAKIENFINDEIENLIN